MVTAASPRTSPLQRLQKLRNEPLEFLSSCCLTLDQADRRAPVKRFPAHLPYFAPIIERLLNDRLVLLRKSRRMVMSWFVMDFNLWDAMFHIGRSIYVVSRKEEGSDELIRRAKFTYDNMPKDVVPILPRMEYKYCRLSFPEIDSQIVGVPQGRDQLRQVTASRIFGDEFAFWEHGEETYGAMRPTIEGGGQIVLVSTSFPGFFKKLIDDDVT